MKAKKTCNILGIFITPTTYDAVVRYISDSISENRTVLLSPLASHTLVRAYFDPRLRSILHSYSGLYPDSQWVRYAMRFLYGVRLHDRVYGPELMRRICRLASLRGYRVFLYGTTHRTLKELGKSLTASYPGLRIVGTESSRFRSLSVKERMQLRTKIVKQNSEIVLVSLGSPLEQLFCHELLYGKIRFNRPLVIIPFGAAFDFLAGVKPQSPKWIGDIGMEWFYRLLKEPHRLWIRYIVLGPVFIVLVLLQKIGLLNVGDVVIGQRK
jgi:N-acetylglucosaminyldiphosphoundecaprenol N-acetyl-beta-D-mannosaminyltransferase